MGIVQATSKSTTLCSRVIIPRGEERNFAGALSIPENWHSRTRQRTIYQPATQGRKDVC